MKRLCFWIYLLVSLDVQGVNGLGILSLRFISYTNPDGKTSDGNCCEHIFPIFGCAPGDCDPSLQMCIHDNTQSGACSNLQYKAGPYDNTESVSFGAKIGALQNPVQLPFQVWKSQFVVSIAVYDDDTDGGHDHIGTATFTPSKPPGYNGTATAYTENIVGGYARLNIVYDVHCLQNFFGDDCTKFCEPDKIHYICDAHGNKVCLQGWTGRNCLLSIDDCHVSACLNFGTCEDLHNTFRCHCSLEFTGDRCETRVHVPNEVTSEKSGLSFLLDKITKIPDFTDTPGQDTFSTEITHLTIYSQKLQNWNSLNLSLSQITTSIPSEEFSSVKTESVLRSKNPDEIGFMETNEVSFYSDLTTAKESASSPETDIATKSIGQSNTILSQSFTTESINVISSAPEENYNFFISTEKDIVSSSREQDVSNETLSIINRTYTLEYNINAVTTKEVNSNESSISNELTSLTNTSSSETLVTSVVNTISNETHFLGITDGTELEALQSTLQPLTELLVEFSQDVDHTGLTSTQIITDLSESTISEQTKTEESMELNRSSTISAQTETEFEILNPFTTSFKETETKTVLEIDVSTTSSKQTDLVTISEQTDIEATDQQVEKNTGSFSEGYTSDDLFITKESVINQRPGNNTGNDTIASLHTKEASLTNGTSNGVTQEAFTSSTLIKTITGNLLTQSTETIENASLVTLISNRTDFEIIQDTTFESKQTDSAVDVTTGEGIYVTKTSHHYTSSSDDYGSQVNVSTVYPEKNHSSSAAVEEFESTLIPPILISSSQPKQEIEQVSSKPVSTINTDTDVTVDGLQTQTFERENTTETRFTSGDIVTENVENFSVAQSSTLQSSSQNLVGDFKTTHYTNETTTVANVDIYYSSIESTKEQNNKSEITTATWSTLSKSSPSITSATSVTFSRIFSKTETESSRASTKEVAITDIETTTSANGKSSRESSVNSLKPSSTTSVLSESIQSTEAETLQSNFSISTKTTIKSTSHSTSSPATCLSRYFLDAIGELVIEVNSSFTFSMVKEEMFKILEDYDVNQKEAKFNYTLYSRINSVWLKFDSRSVPLKMSDLNEISIKVCRSLQNLFSDGPRRESEAGLTSGSLAAITLSLLYLSALLIIAIFLIHRKHKERNKVGSTPTVTEDSWISKAPMKTNLETEQEC